MDAADEDHPKIVAFPPLLWLIGATMSALVHFFVFSIRILPEPFALILGIVCMLAGPSLALPALLTMRAAGTHANPAKPALLIVRGGLIGSLGTRCIWHFVWCRRGAGFY